MPLSPSEKVNLISKESVHGTPTEILQEAMLQHFEEDKKLYALVEKLEDRLNPESDNYVLKPLKPYIQGVAGLGLIWKALIAIGGILIIWTQIKDSFIK